MLANMRRFLFIIELRLFVIRQQVTLRVDESFLGWQDVNHTDRIYSAVENHKVGAQVLLGFGYKGHGSSKFFDFNYEM